MKRSTRRLVLLSTLLLFPILAGCDSGGLEPSPIPTSTPAASPTPSITEPDCPPTAEPFVIAPDEAFEASLKVEEPTRISAEAYWGIGPDRLALLVNGPERPELGNPEAPYARRDGPSGTLAVDYVVTASDTERGSDWRLRVANFGSQAAAGCLEVVEMPLDAPTPTPAPMSRAGLYQVTYRKVSDSCDSEAYPARFDDVLDIRVHDGTIAIHQDSTGDDSAGRMGRDGFFTTSGSGPTHLEVYEGTLEDGRLEAVNTFRQLGCKLEYSVTGERQ